MDKNNVPTLSDFPDFIQRGFINNEKLDISSVKTTIESNFEKSLISEELFCNSMEIIDSLEKGKKADIGEMREWSGKKYQKAEDGWQTVAKQE